MGAHFISALGPEGAVAGNPDRGYYTMVRMMADEGAPPDFAACPYALVLLEINLSAFAARPLDDAALGRIDAALAALRPAGKRAILRFVYDWDGHCWLHEPTDERLVEGHMEALAPLLRARAEAIFTLQGAFVGNWGEMHGSRHLAGFGAKRLIERLCACAGPQTFVSVRTPAYWRACAGTSAPAPQTPLARQLGLYNDALCSSEDDMGTYAPAGSEGEAGKNPAAAEWAFVGALGLFAPVGGETAAVYPRNDPGEFARNMFALRLSYLNADYHADVVARWKKTPYRGGSYFDYIGERLGYRFVAEKAGLSFGSLALRLQNAGAAPVYRPGEATLLFRSEGGEAARVRLAEDIRTWLPGNRLALKAKLPPLPGGEYAVYLALGEGLRLANEGAWQDAANANLLGRLRV